MTPSISVICPAWQAAATLAATLASVSAQVVPATEVLVSDDGSTDDTGAVATAAGAALIRNPHRGAAAALNAGIDASKGSFLSFIDADDLWPADKLAAQLPLLAADPALGGVLGLMQSFLSPEIAPEISAHYKVPDGLQEAWSLGALLVRRRVFDEVGPFEEDMQAGFAVDWFDRARRRGLSFVMPRRVVLLRRIHPGSLGHRSERRDAGYILMARRAIQRRRSGEPG